MACPSSLTPPCPAHLPRRLPGTNHHLFNPSTIVLVRRPWKEADDPFIISHVMWIFGCGVVTKIFFELCAVNLEPFQEFLGHIHSSALMSDSLAQAKFKRCKNSDMVRAPAKLVALQLSFHTYTDLSMLVYKSKNVIQIKAHRRAFFLRLHQFLDL
ncbi:hypothetical protein F5887DRAFT_944930 [Amanita rubescens]|nr:hypothetical protein F5887DRAFT_944930 [Amanita rubescens]